MHNLMDWIGFFFLADMGLALAILLIVVVLGRKRGETKLAGSAVTLFVCLGVALGCLYVGIRLVAGGIANSSGI